MNYTSSHNHGSQKWVPPIVQNLPFSLITHSTIHTHRFFSFCMQQSTSAQFYFFILFWICFFLMCFFWGKIINLDLFEENLCQTSGVFQILSTTFSVWPSTNLGKSPCWEPARFWGQTQKSDPLKTGINKKEIFPIYRREIHQVTKIKTARINNYIYIFLYILNHSP